MKKGLKFGVWVLMGLLVLARLGAHVNGLGDSPQLVNGKLALCPEKPNCISSEAGTGEMHLIEPLFFNDGNLKISLAALKQAIEDTGGSITIATSSTISAKYTSALMGFVDDLQVRADTQTKKIHIRSASRIGKSDFGANLERANELKKHYLESFNSE